MNEAKGKARARRATTGEDDEEPWRHPPVAPKDAGIADSLGKAVSDVVTGPARRRPEKAKQPRRRRRRRRKP
jgi:hypothetical protein